MLPVRKGEARAKLADDAARVQGTPTPDTRKESLGQRWTQCAVAVGQGEGASATNMFFA